jgi:hypothetical protein
MSNLFFYILQKIFLTDFAIFLNMYDNMKFQGLDVVFYDKPKCEDGMASSGIMFVSSFVKSHVLSDTWT